jgi:hypothetical protein
MKTLESYMLVVASALSCFSCDKVDTSRKVTGATAQWMDVTIDGERYYGLAQNQIIAKGAEKTSELSCVVLMPWDARPEASVGIKEDISTIKLPGGEFKIVGRRVCTTTATGDTITLFPDELSAEAYNNREALQNAVIKILTKKQNKTSHSNPH